MLRKALKRGIVSREEVGKRMEDLCSAHRERLSYTDRLKTATVESVKAWIFPSDGEHIHLSGEMSAVFACARLRDRLNRSESGRQILEERPRLRSPFFTDKLVQSCPPNSLGARYYQFMTKYGYSHDERPIVRYIPDEELAYIYQRYKEIHDFYHVCLGKDVTVDGELQVKVFEFVQTQLPSAGLTVAFGPLSYGLAYNPRNAMKLYLEEAPRMVRIAKRAKNFLGVHFEQHLNEDFHSFRKWILNTEDEDDEAFD